MADEAEKQNSSSGGEIDLDTAAKLLMCTQQWVLKLVRDGWIKRQSRGRYRIVDVVQGHIRYMQDENRRAQKTVQASRVQDARAAQIELQNAREAGKLVEIEDVIALQGEIIGTFCTELRGVPAASTRDLELRAEIEKHINGALDRCRSAFEQAGEALRSGRAPDVEGEEADA